VYDKLITLKSNKFNRIIRVLFYQDKFRILDVPLSQNININMNIGVMVNTYSSPLNNNLNKIVVV